MSTTKVEVAEEIARILAAVAKRASENEMPFLAYLISMAEAEARSVAVRAQN